MDYERLDQVDFSLNPEGERCARCGFVARGYAFLGDERYCHPNNPEAPDCYSIASRGFFPRRIGQ